MIITPSLEENLSLSRHHGPTALRRHTSGDRSPTAASPFHALSA